MREIGRERERAEHGEKAGLSSKRRGDDFARGEDSFGIIFA
jgi:hypothetical protein